MIQDLLYYPDEVNVPEGTDIVLFRNKTDGYLYYKKSNGESIKLTDDGNGTIFNIPEPEVGQIFTLVIDTFYKIKFDTGIAIKFFQAQVKAPENPFKKRQGNKIIYNSAPGSVGAQGAQGAQGAAGAAGAQGAQGATGPSIDDFTIYFLSGTISPLDSTTYFFSQGDVVPNTTDTNFRFNLGIAYTIVGAIISTGRNTTAGTTENVTLQIRNITAGTSTSVGTFTTDGSATLTRSKTFTGLAISVGAGDDICAQVDTPAWATNPVGLQWTLTLLCMRV